MAVHLPNQKLTYFSVPKVACSSLKNFFFEIENGFPFQRFKMNGKSYGIHQFAKSERFSQIPREAIEGHVKIAVVREPSRRILSCYRNKVVGLKDLHRIKFTEEQKKMGLVADPSLENFIDLLPHYQSISWSVRHHSRPLAFFLGKDPTFYDRLFAMNQLPDLVDFVSRIVGDVPALRHANKTKSSNQALSQATIDSINRKIEDMYAEDINLYGRYM